MISYSLLNTLFTHSLLPRGQLQQRKPKSVQTVITTATGHIKDDKELQQPGLRSAPLYRKTIRVPQ
jgi:hypothetical protein